MEKEWSSAHGAGSALPSLRIRVPDKDLRKFHAPHEWSPAQPSAAPPQARSRRIVPFYLTALAWQLGTRQRPPHPTPTSAHRWFHCGRRHRPKLPRHPRAPVASPHSLSLPAAPKEARAPSASHHLIPAGAIGVAAACAVREARAGSSLGGLPLARAFASAPRGAPPTAPQVKRAGSDQQRRPHGQGHLPARQPRPRPAAATTAATGLHGLRGGHDPARLTAPPAEAQQASEREQGQRKPEA